MFPVNCVLTQTKLTLGCLSLLSQNGDPLLAPPVDGGIPILVRFSLKLSETESKLYFQLKHHVKASFRKELPDRIIRNHEKPILRIQNLIGDLEV
jgi:hypothetical protein